ncbi:MAG: hypothetical protein WB424_11145 [Terracidiphilus sp.]
MNVKTKVVAIRNFSPATERLLDQARALADFIVGDGQQGFSCEDVVQVHQALKLMVNARREELCQS